MGDSSQPAMGDSSQLCDSDSVRGRLATLTLTNQKGLQVVVSLSPSPSSGSLKLPYNVWWILFSLVPFFCMLAAFVKLMGDPKVFTVFLVLDTIALSGGYPIHMIVLFYLFYLYRDMPFQLIGAKTKFMIEVIPMITAAALHHLLAANYACIVLLISIGCSGYLYTFAHFLHVAYDIGTTDVLLRLVM